MLKEKLEEQLKLLRNSCELYDRGRVEEALKISSTLRTIFYDNNKSNPSLLKQLNQKDTIKLLSTLEDYTKHPLMQNIDVQFSIPIMLTSEGQKPELDNASKKELLFVEEWLNEIVVTTDKISYSRYEIIKTTAHKDGGSHVDKPNTSLKNLKSTIGTFTISAYNRKISQDISNHHYILLRQFAHEVIHSKDLYEANNLQFVPMIKYKTYKEYLSDGHNYQNQKKDLKAIESYKMAIETNPNICEEAYFSIGNIWAKEEKFDDAIDYYKKAIDLNNNYIEAWHKLSLVYEKTKRYDFVIQCCQRILEIDKTNINANHNLVALTGRLTDIKDEILDQYQYAIKNHPTNLTYFHFLTNGLLTLKYYTEAENIFIIALQQYPQETTLLCNYAICIYRKGDANLSKKIFAELLILNPQEQHVWFNILEFYLINDLVLSETIINNYHTFFPDDNVYLEMFVILFKLRDNCEIDYCTETKIDYDFCDIKKWISNLDSIRKETLLNFLDGMNRLNQNDSLFHN